MFKVEPVEPADLTSSVPNQNQSPNQFKGWSVILYGQTSRMGWFSFRFSQFLRTGQKLKVQQIGFKCHAFSTEQPSWIGTNGLTGRFNLPMTDLKL
jgi:hypothetical protein